MAETGIRDSGRFRDDLSKLWNDMYYGNGKPGVVTRLQSLEEAVDRIEATLEKFNKTQDRVVWLIVSAVILAVINLVVRK